MISSVSDANLILWYPNGKVGEIVITNSMDNVAWDRGGGVMSPKGVGKFVKRGSSSLGIWEKVRHRGPFNLETL